MGRRWKASTSANSRKKSKGYCGTSSPGHKMRRKGTRSSSGMAPRVAMAAPESGQAHDPYRSPPTSTHSSMGLAFGYRKSFI
ncbi:hypothetical protein TNCV_2950661 [Trichonephila clavipes]|nr:hypothetical protein TNCV_2950661 [Trichonephila clavipes]